MRTLRTVRNILMAIAISLATWVAVPPKLFINPSSVTIDGTDVYVQRTFPTREALGIPPYIRYVETVRPTDPDTLPQLCQDAAGPFYYETAAEAGHWNIADWAGKCMQNGFTWRAIWVPYFLGVIPLRPVSITYTHFDLNDSGK